MIPILGILSKYIHGDIKDIRFTEYVYRVANDLQKLLNDEELSLLFELKDEPKKIESKTLRKLKDIGIVEETSRGRYMLAKKYYEYVGQKGTYTRRKGLDKETCKELIVKHITNNGRGDMKEFLEVLPDIPRNTINSYLVELRNESRINLVGNPRITKGKNKAYYELNSS